MSFFDEEMTKILNWHLRHQNLGTSRPKLCAKSDTLGASFSLAKTARGGGAEKAALLSKEGGRSKTLILETTFQNWFFCFLSPLFPKNRQK